MKLMKAHKIDLDPISKRTINPEYNLEPENVRKTPIKTHIPSSIIPIENANSKNLSTQRKYIPKANIETTETTHKRVLKACEFKQYDYGSQIASLPFGNNREREPVNDLSIRPQSMNKNHSATVKQLNDLRSGIENLPGSNTNRIPNEKENKGKGLIGIAAKNTLTSFEKNNKENENLQKKKFVSENNKTCIREYDIRESKVKQFQQKKDYLGPSYDEQPVIKNEFKLAKPKVYFDAFKSNLRLY